MTSGLPRRRLLTLTACGALSGCGFQPVYMPTASGNAGPAQRELAAIQVALLPNRPGQLLRQALQDRLELGSSGVPRRYDLTVSFWITSEGVAVQTDNTSTRVRMIGNARWSLEAQDPGHTKLSGGHARSVDAFNVLDTQYFAADLESEATYKRLADAVADQITMQLAIFFRRRAAVAAS